MGVAQASIGSGFSKQIFIVARYRPGGNFIRRFKANVGEKQSSSLSTVSEPTLASSLSTGAGPTATLPFTALTTATTPAAELGIC